MATPLTYVWLRHAQMRLHQRGLDRAEVEAVMSRNWGTRQHNHGAARWRISAEGIVVNFDCPVDGDHRKARIHTVWAS